jgi:hypothetical protein
MIIYIVYLGLLVVAFAFSNWRLKGNKRQKLYEALFASILLFLIFALKNNSVGIDIQSYATAYSANKVAAFTDYSQSLMDAGFITLLKIFAKANIPFQVFLGFIYFIICVCLFYSTLKLSPSPLLSFFIFTTFIYFNFFISGLRQSLAISLCLVALTILLTKGIDPLWTFLYFVIVSLATSFHKSAFVFFIPYFLFYARLNEKSLFFFVPLFLLTYLFGPQIYEAIFIATHNEYPPFSFGPGKIGLLFFAIFLFGVSFSSNAAFGKKVNAFFDRFSKKKVVEAEQTPARTMTRDENKKEIIEEKKVSAYSLMVFIGAFFELTGRYNSGFYRTGLYFSIASIFLIPTILFTQRNKTFKYALTAIVAICFLAFFFYYSIIPNNLNITPYKFFFQE